MNTQFLTSELHNKRILLKCSRSIEFIEVEKIIRIESLRAYCRVCIINENAILLSCPLKAIEEKLSVYPIFFRSHKSHLINMLYVKNYHSDKGIKLADGSYVPLALKMKSAFLEKMVTIFGLTSK
ncbi:MAG: hypothetical protein C0397_19600 [Odoribacter sp.]|nr:hypothetical protein [Odoribacter sp.]